MPQKKTFVSVWNMPADGKFLFSYSGMQAGKIKNPAVSGGDRMVNIMLLNYENIADIFYFDYAGRNSASPLAISIWSSLT